MNRVARLVAVTWLAAVFALSGGLWQVCAALAAVPPAAAAAEAHGSAGAMAGHHMMADDGDAPGRHHSHPGSTDTPLCAQVCAMAGVVILSDAASRIGVRLTATPVKFEHPDGRQIDGIAWLDPDIPKPLL